MIVAQTQYKIPKRVVSVVCHTTSGESISGEVFLDVNGKCRLQQIREFFNGTTWFFPIRKPQEDKPILLGRNVVVMLEVISSAQLLQSEASIALCDRKSAALNLASLGSVDCEILIDSPDDRSRILDVLNQPGQFVSVIRNDNYSLINKLHINGVVEL